jgi:hypothetical protein
LKSAYVYREYAAHWAPEVSWKDQPILSRNGKDPKVQTFMLLIVTVGMMIMRRGGGGEEIHNTAF